jgi:SAM-dependent MidA family methyltransferase
MIALSAALLAPLLLTRPAPAQSSRQEPLNARELGPEIKVAAGAEAAVKDFFPSFFDYQEFMLYHPKVGYYSSGFVSFAADFGTFPNQLAPYFGQMVAEQLFRMWGGMRKAGSLGPNERFTIAEFGGGNGSLAESILDHIRQQSKDNPDKRWGEFARQVVYASYDRSPAMRQAQRDRNVRFGAQFEAHQGDATDLTAVIAPGSLKGIILSNELLDNFSVHKVILSPDGSVEVAFVAPSLSLSDWNQLRKYLPPAAGFTIENDDRAIQDRLFQGREEATVYLSRAALVMLLEALAVLPDYPLKAASIQFREVYVPARVVPALEEHFRRYAHSYANVLAKSATSVVAYINLGQATFIRGAATALKAGYVITVDYGSDWSGILTMGPYGKLRTFGPGSQQDKPDPYRRPGLNDITTDVNFSYLGAEGQSAGLKTVYFGRARALQSGTPISLDPLKTERPLTDREKSEFLSWVAWFRNGRSFKVLVQQQQKTDRSYTYPDSNPEPLESNRNDLTQVQRERAAEIERRLRSAPVKSKPTTSPPRASGPSQIGAD